MKRNKIRISTLDCSQSIILPNVRQIGNSTRLIDNAIQIIFSGYICVIRDHVNNNRTNQFLFDKIMGRLESEHRGSVHRLNIDKSNLEISLK